MATKSKKTNLDSEAAAPVAPEAAETAATEASPAPEANTFTHADKKYKVLTGAYVPLPGGMEKLTVADICIHQEAQEYLVKVSSGCIKQIL